MVFQLIVLMVVGDHSKQLRVFNYKMMTYCGEKCYLEHEPGHWLCEDCARKLSLKHQAEQQAEAKEGKS